MKKIIITLFIIGGISWWSFHQEKVQNFVQQNFNLIVPCSFPITYSVGDFDERFPIKKEELIASLQKAEKSWEDGAEKQLFEYQENGGTLTVNLIYDNRQQVTNTLKQIDTVIDAKEENYNSLKAQYDDLSEAFEASKKKLEQDVQKLKNLKSAFENHVARWNQSDKSSEEEYQKLEKEKNTINALVESVNIAQKNLGKEADSLNALGTKINNLIEELHLNVARFNTTATSNGEEYDEGEYIRNASGQKINIYEFGDSTKLLRVLTHEMGHALSLDHVDDETAIMYRSNQGKQETLTNADIAELGRVCGL